jgi:3-mercaptopyruvate sulfurtransferase SseA
MVLRLLGYERARNFDASYTAWARDPNTPVER